MTAFKMDTVCPDGPTCPDPVCRDERRRQGIPIGYTDAQQATPGQWEVGNDPQGRPYILVRRDEDEGSDTRIIDCAGFGILTSEADGANARLIVAAVNAVQEAGYTVEEMEAGRVSRDKNRPHVRAGQIARPPAPGPRFNVILPTRKRSLTSLPGFRRFHDRCPFCDGASGTWRGESGCVCGWWSPWLPRAVRGFVCYAGTLTSGSRVARPGW